MSKKEALQLFGDKKIRTAWSEEEEKWFFSIVDVVAVLTNSTDSAAYWRKLKERLKKEGNETVTNCHAFKMTAAREGAFPYFLAGKPEDMYNNCLTNQ